MENFEVFLISRFWVADDTKIIHVEGGITTREIFNLEFHEIFHPRNVPPVRYIDQELEQKGSKSTSAKSHILSAKVTACPESPSRWIQYCKAS